MIYDQILSLTRLQALLADNAGGHKISPQRLRNFLVTVDPENSEVLNPTFGSSHSYRKTGHIQRYLDSYYIIRDNFENMYQELWGPIFPFNDPNKYSWSWFNQGGATMSISNGGIFLNAPASAGDNCRCIEHALPPAPYIVTAIFQPCFPSVNFMASGMYLRNSSGNPFVSLMFNDRGWYETAKWNSPTSYNAGYPNNFTEPAAWSNPKIIRIIDDLTTRYFQFSTDNNAFMSIYNVSRTDFVFPDRVGFFVNSNNASNPCLSTLLSWKETSP